MQLMTHVRATTHETSECIYTWVREYILFRNISCTNHLQKKTRNQRRRQGCTFLSFQYFSWTCESVFARCFKRIETFRYRRISKETMHIHPGRTRAVRMFVAEYEREISFSAMRSNKYFSSGMKPAIPTYVARVFRRASR